MKNTKFTRDEALAFHMEPVPGKWEVNATVPMATQRDLSLAYSPGVAVPCSEISENPELAYDYTNKGNLVAVISNGTAVLGLGNLGALGSKPVMEGKSVLFKRFADVNSIDIELDTEDPEEFCQAVKLMGPTFGGINLEDIRAPECFIIEQRLKEEMDIPVFHDDQHGTAVICAAGLINALYLSEKKIENVKIVLNGAGAAGIACIELLKFMGARHENCIVCDTKGVIFQGRTKGMNQWKSAHAAKTKARTLAEALDGADVFIGVSVKGAVTQEMLKTMAKDPVIFAMANPDPEITPEEAHEVRIDAIVATGRSDYPNQVNNVLGFPYLFRGALDIHARAINEEMKIACATALAELAREDVPDEVAVAYGRELKFGRDYIIPTPFDPRLIFRVPPAVAKAGMHTGAARRPIIDLPNYELSLKSRMDPTASILQGLHVRARSNQATMIFAEGDDPRVLKAAVTYQRSGLGKSLVIGRDDDVRQRERMQCRVRRVPRSVGLWNRKMHLRVQQTGAHQWRQKVAENALGSLREIRSVAHHQAEHLRHRGGRGGDLGNEAGRPLLEVPRARAAELVAFGVSFALAAFGKALGPWAWLLSISVPPLILAAG